MYSLEDISIKAMDIEKILPILDKYGICVVESYLDNNDLELLTKEHDKVFIDKDPGISIVHKHPTNQYGMVARCLTNELSDAYSATKNIFLSDEMNELSSQYFGSEILLNNDVFFTHEKESDVPILPWHFDRKQSLKFYINLLDVDERNGAFSYDLGSHREGHFRANYYLLSGVKIGEIPNDVPQEELHNPLIIEVKAGDLVIFDSDGFHKGGIVSPSHERKVVRGHTHPIPNRGYEPGLFDVMWWLNSPFNIAKYLCKRGTRKLPNGKLTKSVRTR